MIGKILKNRILRSRPFLAMHVLVGRPVMYRMTVVGPLLRDARNNGARFVGNTVIIRDGRPRVIGFKRRIR